MCENLPDRGPQVASVWGQDVQCQSKFRCTVDKASVFLATGEIEFYFLHNLDHLKRFPDVPFHKRAVKTWQNISFYSHSVGAQPLPPSSLEQTRVWLAVNEDGLSVLDYTMVSECRYLL